MIRRGPRRVGRGRTRRPGFARGRAARVAAGASLVALAVALSLVGSLRSFGVSDGFPHAEHARIFPTCLGCHAGVPEGDAARYYTVEPGECANCHDGTRVGRVEWSGPTRRASNLAFTHPEHEREAAEAGEAPESCGTCHGVAGGTRRMDVDRARPETCLSCHAHEADTHLAAEARCSTCHLPLAEADRLPESRVAAFPEPPAHEAEDFLFQHGKTAAATGANCTVCHARQSCARCHLNADRLSAVERVPPDPRIAAIVAGREGEWPEPASHDDEGWTFTHGRAAVESLASCGNCHAAPSCAACHGAAAATVAAGLPRPERGQPAGVRVSAIRPPGHTPDFWTNHGAAAATAFPDCSSCHAETECAACHERTAARMEEVDPVGRERARDAGGPEDAAAVRERREAVARGGEGTGGFHPVDFVVRHGAEAYAETPECAQCHSNEAFCRSCHESVGIAAVSQQVSGAFHDGQADWLIAHGRAARQGLEECAACHRQSSCLRCHSARSGLRISPHGPGFDANRLLGKAAVSCAVCHFRDSFVFP